MDANNFHTPKGRASKKQAIFEGKIIMRPMSEIEKIEGQHRFDDCGRRVVTDLPEDVVWDTWGAGDQMIADFYRGNERIET